MSLHNLAKHVQDHGRGNDTQLMHVTPNEIKGLQSLAVRNGTSLTTNPYTGLPEAGVLDKLLPTIIGAAGAYFGVSPAMTGLITGGVNYAMTGNLQKGIMSGLGAWGGASLMSNVMGAGSGLMGSELLGSASQAGSNALDPSLGSYGQDITPQQLSEGVAKGTYTPEQANAYGDAFNKSFDPARNATGWDQTTKGFSAIKQNPGSFFKDNMFPIAATAAPLLMKDDSSSGGTAPVSQGTSYVRPYEYSQTKNPRYGEPGEPYFIQSQTAKEPVPASQWGNRIYPSYADGGLASLSNGGKQDNMFPQSQEDSVQFAVPTQMPTSAEVVNSDFGPTTRPYTGEIARMADGGGVKAAGSAGDPTYKIPGITGVTPLALAAPTNTYSQSRLPAPSQAVTNFNTLLADRANNEYNVQPVPLNMLPGGGQNAGAGDLGKIINQYYVKNLGREADQPGLEAWTKAVQTGTKLSDINSGIAGSQEGLIYNAYKDLLGRKPDAEGMKSWQAALEKGTTPEQLREAFINSPEYRAKNPPAFDPKYYLAQNPDVAKAGMDPWTHYQQYGMKEGRVGAEGATAGVKLNQAVSPTADTSSTPGGWSYDPKTGRYTPPAAPVTPAAPAPDVTGTAEDPAFQAWLKQDELRRWQQSQQNNYAAGGPIHKYAAGGITSLGSYSDGGQLLKGPGDGVSDNIPAQIGQHQPARLADGEFVIPARIVSELGNGSTDAGARRLYDMMDRIQQKRAKSSKKGKFAINSNAAKELPV
jgi:hypothetical protein